jgi:uroporphyrinogen decarboxylase
MKEMTKRERMMMALSGKVADRIPVAPDMSFMIPCKMQNKPFYEVLLYGNPSLSAAYIEAVKYYDIDAWFTYGYIEMQYKTDFSYNSSVEKDNEGKPVLFEKYDTPKGALTKRTVYPIYDCDTPIEKLIKDFEEDFPKYKYLLTEPIGYNNDYFNWQKKELGDLGIMCVGLFPPGMQIFNNIFDGNVQAAIYAYYDNKELFDELCYLYEKQMFKQLEFILENKPDSILTGGSGSITLQSPELFDELSFPSIQKITRLCKEAGVISGIHSCGREMHIVERCANETDLNYINPLEIAPMGDSDLATAKKLYGDKIALMGNLHTTQVMLFGGVKDVRRESLKAILAAGEGGGFVLSTGDQCGRDTPEENIKEMVSVCKEFGTYPLNIDKISEELKKL